MENPLRSGLGSDILEVRNKVFVFPERRTELAFGKAVATLAADGLDKLLAAGRLIAVSLANTGSERILL